MIKSLLRVALAVSVLAPAYALGQLLPNEQESRFTEIIMEANKHRERYDTIVEYKPRLAHDSEVTDPEKVATAWAECKRSMAAARSYGHAQQMDAFFVAYPDGHFTTSKERADIGIALALRNRKSNAELEPALYKCLKDLFSVNVRPFP